MTSCLRSEAAVGDYPRNCTILSTHTLLVTRKCPVRVEESARTWLISIREKARSPEVSVCYKSSIVILNARLVAGCRLTWKEYTICQMWSFEADFLVMRRTSRGRTRWYSCPYFWSAQTQMRRDRHQATSMTWEARFPGQSASLISPGVRARKSPLFRPSWLLL